MGFVDRGGGREAKGSSLRRSKKNPGAPTTRNKGANKNYITPATRATPTPPPACVPLLRALAAASAADAAAAEGAASTAPAAASCGAVEKAVGLAREALTQGTAAASLHVDAAVALLSRKLEDDQEGIFRRAVEDGKLAAMVCWCGEVERQSLLLDACVQHNKLHRGAGAEAGGGGRQTPAAAAGGGVGEGARHVHFKDDAAVAAPGAVVASITTAAACASPTSKAGVNLYAILGVHVNNIDRVNMRLHEQWIKELETNVKHGDVVGVLSGLNLSRDHGTHYAQERLLKECWRVAAEVRLPLVLHLSAADAASLTDTVNRAAELLSELLAAATAAAAVPSSLVLYDGLRVLHASPAMQQLVRTHRPDAALPASAAAAISVPFYVLATADGLSAVTAAEEGGAAEGPTAEALAALLPPRVAAPTAPSRSSSSASPDAPVVLLSQLLVGTGAPFGTPQNLPDPYLCTLPNEPGNYPYVVQTLYDAMRATPAEGTALHLTDLSAIAVVNHLRVFFGECITASAEAAVCSSDDEDDDEDSNKNSDDAAAEGVEGEGSAARRRQEEWAALQRPAAPTAVAGITDGDAKRDLEALLAEAARERERVEEERRREEAEREQARTEELNEKRSRREKKKNVKANNRSNFTHFRNKDFAPRQSKQEKLAHQRDLEGVGGDEGDSSGDSDGENGAAATAAAAQRKPTSAHPTRPSESSSLDSDGDGDVDASPGSLAAEVERLLQANAVHQDPERVAQPGGRGKAKKKAAKAAAAAAGAGKGSSSAGGAGAVKRGGQSDDSDSSDDDDDSDAAAGAATAQMMTKSTAAQNSRRQRKRQQKRQQQQHQSNRSDDDDD